MQAGDGDTAAVAAGANAMTAGSADAGAGRMNAGAGASTGTRDGAGAASAKPDSGPATANTGTGMSNGGAASPRAGGGAARDDADAGPTGDQICSGCAGEVVDAMDMTIHLHHVHLKSADRERSFAFYEKFLAAKRVELNGVTDALLTTPILLLVDQVTEAPRSALPVALQHVGFGSTNVTMWYDAAHAQGVMPDTRGNTLFNTNETPTESGPTLDLSGLLSTNVPACYPKSDTFGYMYVLGPDQERIEIWSGTDQRVNHVHFTSPDIPTTGAWYQQFLGIEGGSLPLVTYQFFLDDILFFFEPIADAASYQPTDDFVLSHIAFSVANLAAWRERARMQQIQVVSEPAMVNGFLSFFVRGPDGTLIELVQAAPSKLLCPGGATK